MPPQLVPALTLLLLVFDSMVHGDWYDLATQCGLTNRPDVGATCYNKLDAGGSNTGLHVHALNVV